MVTYMFSIQCEEIGMKHLTPPRGVHCENTRKQRAGKYRVINIHKRKHLEFS